MKKRILSILLATIMIVSLVPMTVFAEPPATAPMVVDVNDAGYDVSGEKYVLAVYFDEPITNDVVWTGTYNAWSTNVGDMKKFEALEGFSGWYVAEFEDESSSCQGKIVQLMNDGSFNTYYQSADVEAWIDMAQTGTKHMKLDISASGETICTLPEKGVYIYEMTEFIYPIIDGTPESAKETNHGYITVDKATARKDATVTVTVKPDEGYPLKTLKYNDGEDHTLTVNKDGKSTFKMPAKAVTVTAEFVEFTAPPAPTVPAANVKAIMCDIYQNNSGFWPQGWGGCGWHETCVAGMNFRYANTMAWDCFASDWQDSGVAAYDNLHFDIWFAEDGNAPVIKLEFNGNDPTAEITIPGTYKAGWNSVNINVKDVFGEQPMDKLKCLTVKVTKEGGPVAWANILFYNGDYTSTEAAIHVHNLTGWDPLYLYMWGDGGNDLGGAWPGFTTPRKDENGLYFFIPHGAYDGESESLIFNNGNGAQLADYTITSLGESYELWVTLDGVFDKSPAYAITNGTAEGDKETNHGYITVNETAAEGDTVTVTVTADEGYALKTLKYNDGEDHDIVADDKGTYAFTMPAAAVTVTAEFEAATEKPVDTKLYWGFDDNTKAFYLSKTSAAITDKGASANEFDSTQVFHYPEEPVLPWANVSMSVQSVEILNDIAPGSTAFWFYSMTGLKQIKGIEHLYTGNVTSMAAMFSGCTSLESLDVSHFDTSAVTNMNNIFCECAALKTLDVSNFDTSKVTVMVSVFSGCAALTTLDVSNFNTSNVTHMLNMFSYCTNLQSLDLSNFDTSKVTDMMDMFCECPALRSLDLSGFDTTSVETMRRMFYGCSSLASLDLSGFDTTSVTDMREMFNGCSSLASLDLPKSGTPELTHLQSMFNGCTSLKTVDLSNFNLSKCTGITSAGSIFSNCSAVLIKTPKNLGTSLKNAKLPVVAEPMKWYNADKLEVYESNSLPAGQANSITLVAGVPVRTWSELQDAINAAPGSKDEPATATTNFILANDLTVPEQDGASITIPNGKDITIDLNGHVLNAGGKCGAIKVNEGKLSVIDSLPETEHYFNVDATTGLWTLTDTKTDKTKTVKGGVITGGYDIYFGGVNVGKDATFDMNGGSIVGNTATGTGNVAGGVNCQPGSSFTMKDSNICGNVAADGAGGVNGCGSAKDSISFNFTMTNSSVCGNTCPEGTGGVSLMDNASFTMINSSIADNVVGGEGNVGGVYVNESSFTMTGSSITGNTGVFFGGVYVNESSLTMINSRITDNTASMFGGVFICNTSTVLGGTTVIKDNLVGETASNLVLFGSADPVKLGTGTDAPKDGMSVAVTLLDNSMKPAGGAFTTNGTADDAKYFTSDSADYFVNFNTNHLELKKTAYIEGSTLYVDGMGKLGSLDAIPDKDTITAIVVSATVTGAEANAFAGFGSVDFPVALTLPDGWQGDLPDDEGKWYGGYVILFDVPTAVKDVTFQQRWPWNAYVDITADVTGSGELPVAVNIYRKDGESWVKLTSPAVMGDSTVDLTSDAEASLSFLWNAATDLSETLNEVYVEVVLGEQANAVSGKSEAGKADLRTTIALPEKSVTVEGVTWSGTAWGAAPASRTTDIGWKNMDVTPNTTGKITEGLTGNEVASVILPAKDGTYQLTHSTGNMESFVTFTVTGYSSSYAITNGSPEGDKETKHGYISIDKSTAAENDTVTVTVKPETGYELKTLKYNDGEDHTINVDKDGKYTFKMPAANVTVTAEFEAAAPEATIEIKNAEFYNSDAENDLKEFDGGNEDYYFHLFVQTDTVKGDFKDAVDLKDSCIVTSDGSTTINLLKVYSFSVTGEGKDLTLTASVLGSDNNQYDISATGYDGYIEGDAVDGCDIGFAADEISVQQIKIGEVNYISVEGESAAGDSMKIAVKGELNDGKLPAGTYTDIAASAGFTESGTLPPSYIGNNTAVWFIQSGTLTVAADGSMEFEGLNSHDETVAITILAPAPTSQYKYTDYENWQLKHEGSEWEWTENLVKVEEGLFKLADANWTGSGFNVGSDANDIKKDWFAPEELILGEDVIPPINGIDVYLRVMDDETVTIGVGVEPPAPAPTSQYKYTEYENWQLKHEGSEWEWTENLVKVADGLFKLADANWTGSGFNVGSDANDIKKDWFAPEELILGEDVIPPINGIDVYLRVMDDETVTIGVGVEPPAWPKDAPAVAPAAPTVDGASIIGAAQTTNYAFEPLDWPGNMPEQLTFATGETIYYLDKMSWQIYTNWDEDSYDMSQYSMLHIDLFPATGTEIKITFEGLSADDGGQGYKKSVVKTLTAGQWNALDIALSEFPALSSGDAYDFSDIRYLILEGYNAEQTALSVGNVYFYGASDPTGNEKELFNPQNASVDHTWGEFDDPEATWNPATKELSIGIVSRGGFQWGNQVYLDTGITTLDTTKEYQVSFTATASTDDCGGVTFKAFDNNTIAFANQNLSLTTTPFNYVSDWTTPSSASANGKIVFDFGWDKAQTVTITNISLKERTKQPQGAIEPVDVIGGKIVSGETEVEITTTTGIELPDTALNEVAAQINKVLDNETVKNFGKVKENDDTGIIAATDASKNAIAEALKAETTDTVAQGNVTETDISKYLNVTLVSAEVNAGIEVTVTAMTFDVTPMATITVTGSNGEVTLTTEITNDEIDDTVTFLLPVDSSNEALTAAVYHEDEFLGNFEIKTDGSGNKYIEVSTKSFSKFGYITLDESTAGAKIGTTLYASLSDAVSKVANNETIKLLKDASGTITVSRAVKFTVDANGNTNNATITAGSGYSVRNSGNTYTVTMYNNGGLGGLGGFGGINFMISQPANVKNGKLEISPKSASAGQTVTLTVTPDNGFALETLTVLNKNGKEVKVENIGDGKFSFTMPSGNVTISATFQAVETTEPEGPDEPVVEPDEKVEYTDVEAGAWYEKYVDYMTEKGYMNGIGGGKFGVFDKMTRGMFITTLWRFDGEKIVNFAMRFSDVMSDEWYTEAVRWGASEEIVKGYDDENYGVNDPITREQLITILYRYAEKLGLDVSVDENTNFLSFDDVFEISEYARPAMFWALENGIINGTSESTLSPKNDATRVQVAAIFERFCELLERVSESETEAE